MLRHATVAPETSEDRVNSVFPGKPSLVSSPLHLPPASTTLQDIITAFEAVENDMEASKAFIAANMDHSECYSSLPPSLNSILFFLLFCFLVLLLTVLTMIV